MDPRLAARANVVPMELTCPKCQGVMRSYERNGVHVDQCTECRGIFLDRGELERLVDAETTFSSRVAGPVPGPAPQHAQPQPMYQNQYPGQDKNSGHHQPKKRNSLFEELFD